MAFAGTAKTRLRSDELASLRVFLGIRNQLWSVNLDFPDVRYAAPAQRHASKNQGGPKERGRASNGGPHLVVDSPGTRRNRRRRPGMSSPASGSDSVTTVTRENQKARRFGDGVPGLRKASRNALAEPPIQFAVFLQDSLGGPIEIIVRSRQKAIHSSLREITRINAEFPGTFLKASRLLVVKI